MCLLIEIRIPSLPRRVAGDVSKATAAAPGILHLQAQRQPKHTDESRFHVCEGDEGCACSLLADSADWNAGHLDLDPEKVPLLVNTIRHAADIAGPAGFEIRSAWLTGAWPDAKEPPQRLTLSSLLAIVRSKRLPVELHAHVEPD